MQPRCMDEPFGLLISEMELGSQPGGDLTRRPPLAGFQLANSLRRTADQFGKPFLGQVECLAPLHEPGAERQVVGH